MLLTFYIKIQARQPCVMQGTAVVQTSYTTANIKEDHFKPLIYLTAVFSQSILVHSQLTILLVLQKI